KPVKMQHQAGTPPTTDKGATPDHPAPLGKNPDGTTTAAGAEKAPLIKAGTILFGVLDTAVDSDYPDTPVMVTIVQGPMKGAKLLGKLNLAQGKDKVSLNFTLMDRDDWI